MPKGYGDLEEYNPHLDSETLKIIQNANVSIPAHRKKQTVIVQNINVENPARRKEDQSFYESVFEEIYQLGGMRNFINQVYRHAIEYYGSKSRAAIKLGINRSSLTLFERKDG